MRFVRTSTIALAALCLTAMAALTCANVFMRYFLKHPIFGASEIVNSLLGVAVFAGMSIVALDRDHISVSLFEQSLIRVMGRGYIRLYDAVALAGTGAVTAILAWKVHDLFEYSEVTVVLRFPVILIVSALAFLSAISTIATLFALTHETSDAPPHVPHGFE